jgi:hypothetical protein
VGTIYTAHIRCSTKISKSEKKKGIMLQYPEIVTLTLWRILTINQELQKSYLTVLLLIMQEL